MAELSRTFVSSGESDSKAPPEVSVEIPPSIMPVIEACRPVGRARPSSATAPMDESTYLAIAASVAAGAGPPDASLFTLRRGLWRIVVQGTQAVSGAVAASDTHFICALVGPDAVYGPGLHLVQTAIGSVSGNSDFLIHLPTDEWSIGFELSDPVTALSVNRFRGSVYVCHLL
jgi:hypothetical protein